MIRTNEGPEEGRIICTSTTKGGDQGINQDGRRLGFLTERGCKTIGDETKRGNKLVIWFSREDGDIKVLVDDEPAVQEDGTPEPFLRAPPPPMDQVVMYKTMYEAARDELAETHEWIEILVNKLNEIQILSEITR